MFISFPAFSDSSLLAYKIVSFTFISLSAWIITFVPSFKVSWITLAPTFSFPTVPFELSIVTFTGSINHFLA